MIDGRVVIPLEAAVVVQVASVKQSGTLKGQRPDWPEAELHPVR